MSSRPLLDRSLSSPRSHSTTTSTPALSLLVVLALGLLAAVGPFATDMYLPAFPDVVRALDTDAVSVQLTLTTFMAGGAVGQLLFGPLSDRFGRWRPLLIGTALALVAGILAAAAPTIDVLIAARALQGFGAAAGGVIGRAVVADTTNDERGARIFGVLMMIVGIAPIVAPLAGAPLLALGGWRATLWGIVALTVVVLIAVFAVPESLRRDQRERGGLRSVLGAARAVAGNRVYLAWAVAVVAGFGVLFTWVAASPFVLQSVFGLTTTEYAITFAANATGFVLAGLLNGRLLTRFGPRRLVGAWLLLSLGASAVLFVLTITRTLTLPAALACIFLATATAAPVMANGTALAMRAVAPAHAGSASALIGAGESVLAAVAPAFVALWGELTVVPMASGMFALAVVALAAAWLARPRGVRSV